MFLAPGEEVRVQRSLRWRSRRSDPDDPVIGKPPREPGRKRRWHVLVEQEPDSSHAALPARIAFSFFTIGDSGRSR